MELSKVTLALIVLAIHVHNICHVLYFIPLFRTTEGAESILFREKFCDWPEPGRIIKMKGHVSSGEVLVSQW